MYDNLKDYLRALDTGQKVQSVIMGGLGTGYEKAIQSLFIEICRGLRDENPSIYRGDKSRSIGLVSDKAVKKLNEEFGFSDAQVGFAENLAGVFWYQGPEIALRMIRKEDPDRLIFIFQDPKDGLQVEWYADR